jgi:hypothetical protein
MGCVGLTFAGTSNLLTTYRREVRDVKQGLQTITRLSVGQRPHPAVGHKPGQDGTATASG